MQVGDIIGIEKEFSDGWARGQNISQGRKRCIFPLAILTPITSGPSQAVSRRKITSFRNRGDSDSVQDANVRIPDRTTSIQRLSTRSSKRSLNGPFSTSSKSTSSGESETMKSVFEETVEEDVEVPDLDPSKKYKVITRTIYGRQRSRLIKTVVVLFKNAQGFAEKVLSTTFDDAGNKTEDLELFGNSALAFVQNLEKADIDGQKISVAKYLKTTAVITKIVKKRVVKITATVYKAKDATVLRVTATTRDELGNVIKNQTYETYEAIHFLLETFGSILTENETEYVAVEQDSKEFELLENIVIQTPGKARTVGPIQDIVEDDETVMKYVRIIKVTIERIAGQVVRRVVTVCKTMEEERVFKVVLSTLDSYGVPIDYQELEGEEAATFVQRQSIEGDSVSNGNSEGTAGVSQIENSSPEMLTKTPSDTSLSSTRSWTRKDFVTTRVKGSDGKQLEMVTTNYRTTEGKIVKTVRETFDDAGRLLSILEGNEESISMGGSTAN
jgi:hypothetical protein